MRSKLNNKATNVGGLGPNGIRGDGPLLSKVKIIKSFEDLCLSFESIPKEIIRKVGEGFQCLVEVYHLYGLERPTDWRSRNKYEGRIQKAVTRMLSYLKNSGDSSLWVSYFKYKTCAFFSYFEGQDIPDAPPGLKDDRCSVIFFSKFVNHFKRKDMKLEYAEKLFPSFLMSINQAKMGMPRNCESAIAIAEEKCARHLTTQPPPLRDVVLSRKIRRPESLPRVDDIFNLRFGITSESRKIRNQRSWDLFSDNLSDKDRVHFDEELFREFEENMEFSPRAAVKPHINDDFKSHDIWGNSRIKISKEIMCNELKRTAREMFGEARYTKSIHYEPFYPSTSSNYNRTRKGLGAVGEMSELISLLNLDTNRGDLLDIDFEDAVFSTEKTLLYGDKGIEDQIRLDIERLNGITQSGKALTFNDDEFKKEWRIFFDHLFVLAYHEDPLVEPLGLLEALKIRVISKGPPKLYTLLKPMQNFLWKTLKSNKVFSLIGKPVTEKIINETFSDMHPDHIIVNGDYKASTDNLHSWVSECLANEICDVLNENNDKAEDDDKFHITEEFREMLIRSLIHHKYRVDGEWKEQLEGQLMGSITSFPFLCLANAAFCRWALEFSDFGLNGNQYRLRDKPDGLRKLCKLLVNGDDCTLRGDRRFLRLIWEEITRFGGLSSSVGKTFFSLVDRPICMINSIAFDYIDNKWIERKYVNMGILLGKKRSIGVSENESIAYEKLGTLHRMLHERSPSKIWDQVSLRFIYFNTHTLKQCPDIPWSIPEYLGGPGLVPNAEYSEMDLRCATILKNNMKRDGGFNKKNLKIETIGTHAEWQLHKLVDDRLRPFIEKGVKKEIQFENGRGTNGFESGMRDIFDIDLFQDFEEQFNCITPFEDLSENYSKLYKYIVIETLFKNELKEVHHGYSKRDWKKFLKWDQKKQQTNNNAWSVARTMAYDLPSDTIIMGQHEVAYEKKDFVTPVITSTPWKNEEVFNPLLEEIEKDEYGYFLMV